MQNPYLNDNNLKSTSFISPMEGWVVGENGTILRTTDGGNTWAKQESGTNVDLFDVSFTDPNT